MQRKSSPDRSYGEKLISLFAQLLFTGRAYSLSELAKSLECSKQSVLRLIDDITLAYDVALQSEMRGNRKYIWIDRRPGLEPAALLSESEHRTLQMCRAFTEHLVGTRTYRELQRAVEKSGLHLPVGDEPGQPTFGVVRTGTIDYSKSERVLRTLMDGMDQRRVCEVAYKKLGARRSKIFRIKPLKVFSHRESVYVHARLAKMPGEPYKTPDYDPLLAVHRFTKATLTETPFRRPPNYDFEAVMNQGFGIWNHKKFRVVMELDGWAAAFAREREWSPNQSIEDHGDRIVLSFWSTSRPEVQALVLSFGANARLVEPKELADDTAKEIEAMGEKCGRRG
jgi:predicted DNA-binding transcriptional regulator YafY